MLNTRGWEAYRILDFPVTLLDLLSPPIPPSPLLIFRLFSGARNVFLKFFLKRLSYVLHSCVGSIALIWEGRSGSYSAYRTVQLRTVCGKGIKFFFNFTFLITLCQQFFKHFNIYNSLVEFFYLNIWICKSFFEVYQNLCHN